MGFKDCVRNAHEAGEITLEERQALEKRFDALHRQLKSRGAAKEQLAADIAAEAAEKKRRALLTETKRQQRLAEILNFRDHRGRQDIAQALVYMIEHHGQAKFQDVEGQRVAILGMAHAEFEAALYEFRKGWIKGDYRRRGGEVAARLDNVVREAAGEATGDVKAKALADKWLEIADRLRQRFNAAGGAIGKLQGWFLPQLHDGEALLKAGFDEWRTFILPRLDRERMTSPITGRTMTDLELDEALDHVWKTVTSNGWFHREASGGAVGRGALFRQHADHRFLHFKDADTWLEYQRAFGQGDPFAAMMGHINTMVRDIAMMERLGPNPRAMLEYLKQVVVKAGESRETIAQVRARQMARLEELRARFTRNDGVEIAFERLKTAIAELDRLSAERGTVLRRKADQMPGDYQERLAFAHQELHDANKNFSKHLKGENVSDASRAEAQDLVQQMSDLMNDIVEPVAGVDFGRRPMDRIGRKLAAVDAMYDLYTGATNTPVSSTAANVLRSARDWISASSLGSAMLTAFSDAGFQMMARHFNGLPVARQVLDLGRSIATGGRREAVRAGLMLDASVHVMQQQAQYVGSINTSTISGFLADRVLAASGLSAWTQGGKHAYGMAIQATLADHVGIGWRKLPDALREMMDRHGLGERDWNAMRAAGIHDPEGIGAGLLRPQEIAQSGGEALAERYLAMILRETKYAVPEPTLRSRVALIGESQPGTARGEVLRAMSQFKSFGVAVVMLHGGRIFREVTGGTTWRGATYAGGLLISTTLLGGLSLQLKELAGGRDPRDAAPTSARGAKFWGQAMLQGGGMGLWGDFLFSDVNRFGGGMAQTLAGPMVDRFDQVRRLTVGNVQQAATGEKTGIGRESVNFLKQNTPGASLWWLRLAWERVAMDQLQQLSDPDAHAAFRRRMQSRRRDYGNGYWWAPGETGPRRPPALFQAR